MASQPSSVPIDPARASRLLQAMHKIISHDLPNHFVVVQSLIQLLDLEERANLGAQGQEYIIRLIGAAQRAGRLCKFLKDMDWLASWSEKPETFVLAPVLGEVTAELAQAAPPITVTWSIHGPVHEISFGRRSLHKCLQATLRMAAEILQTAQLRAEAEAHPEAKRVRFGWRIQGEGSSALPAAVPARHDTMSVAQRPEFLFAKELAAGFNSDLQAALESGTLSTSLTIPGAHG